MSNLRNYCYIDNKNLTNECEDPNYIRLYYNKDSQVSNIYSYGPPPSMSPGPIHPKNQMNPGDSLQNNLPYSKKDIPTNYESPNQRKIINTQMDNKLLYDNSTLEYAHKNLKNK
jgi:hypothetical protein